MMLAEVALAEAALAESGKSPQLAFIETPVPEADDYEPTLFGSKSDAIQNDFFAVNPAP